MILDLPNYYISLGAARELVYHHAWIIFDDKVIVIANDRFDTIIVSTCGLDRAIKLESIRMGDKYFVPDTLIDFKQHVDLYKLYNPNILEKSIIGK